MPNIKIFSTHIPNKQSYKVKNEIFMPVMGGATTNNNQEIQGDNIGDNISSYNPMFCELTTQYWAWKNVTADYYGFCHYRRFFSFADEKLQADDAGVAVLPSLNDKSVEKLNLDKTEKIKEIVSGYDVVLPEVIDLTRTGFKSVTEQYKSAHKLNYDDIELMLSVIRDIYPEDLEYANKYLNGKSIYYCNMFIMKKDIFFEYSEWLFNILFEFTKRWDNSNCSIEHLRTPGHLGERLLGIFCLKLQENKEIKFTHKQLVVFASTSHSNAITPVFSEKYIPVVFNINNNYAPFCAVTIKSIINCSSKNNNYDLIVLERELSERNKEIISSLIRDFPNFSIRFINVASKINEYNLFVSRHFTPETYFRLLIPELLCNYEKVIYLDVDLIVMKDIYYLYEYDMDNKSLAGVIDIVSAGVINGFDKKQKNYYKEHVLIKETNLLKMINGGVLILDLNKMRSRYTSHELLRYAELGNFQFCDQDVLNALFQDDIEYLPFNWNIDPFSEGDFRHYVSTFAPKNTFMLFKAAINEPYIIHFAGTEKPWFNFELKYSDVFWKLLRETPYYEYILNKRMLDVAWWVNNSNGNTNDKISKVYKFIYFMKNNIVVLIMLPMGSKRREMFKKFYKKLKR
ncbi:DUF4422 domain-containing protein [Paenibacillus sp. SI8]|uniref:DUF4422 domain-containing protein n=1 Tax=unclassified Paenibacillus TaxID=185978 RepID=UPI0034658DD7